MSISMNRRGVLGMSAALGLVGSVKALGLDQAAHADPAMEGSFAVPDEGWILWLDRAAEWQQDEIHLPERVPPNRYWPLPSFR